MSSKRTHRGQAHKIPSDHNDGTSARWRQKIAEQNERLHLVQRRNREKRRLS